jgi:methionine-rich copper-binding protein CopC
MRRVIAVAATAAIAMVTLLATPAFAHSKLTSTSPADGTILDSPPISVSFTFDEALLPGADTISVNDDQGNVVATEPVTPDGPSISMPWPASAGAGTFQVAYRVVSGDGHPVTGAISVTIDDPATASPSASPVAPPDTATTTAGAESDQPPGVASALVVIIAIAVVVLIVLAAITIARRRRQI